MNTPQNPKKPNPFPIMAIAAFALLGVSVAMLVKALRRPEPPVAVAPADPTDDSVIEEALRRAEPDSSAIKTQWVESVPDVDLASLTGGQGDVFIRYVNARSCTCGCGFTLGACRNFDPTCEVSAPIVAALLDSVRAGHLRSVAGLRERPGDAG